MTWLGLAVVSGYLIHAGYHLWNRRPEDLLWACHIGALAVGLGLMARSPALNAIGVLFLTVGVPLWLLDLAMGGEFAPTSVLTHILGLVAGVVGVRQLGMPQHAWWRAALACMLLVGACRLFTPARSNANVSFAVHKGYESWFPSHGWYMAVLGLAVVAIFFAAEHGYRRWVQP